jgi:hypothetical protein
MWTIGREREKSHAAKFVREEGQQGLLFPVIDAVHDMKEGSGGIQDFIVAARIAMIEGGSGVWQNTVNWMRKVVPEQPAAQGLWDELADHESWRVRWRVACCLYLDIPDSHSDRLFSSLRADRSKKVRDYAVARYEYRPDKHGKIEKRFDAASFGN